MLLMVYIVPKLNEFMSLMNLLKTRPIGVMSKYLLIDPYITFVKAD